MSTDHVHVYRDAKHKLRWSFIATNGPILADSGQGYSAMADLQHAFEIVTGRALPAGSVKAIDCPRHARDPFLSNPCLVYDMPRRPVEPAEDGEPDPTASPITGGHR